MVKNLLIVTQKVDKDDQLLGFFIDWVSRFAQKFGKITILCLEKGEFNLPSNVRVLSLGKDRGAGKLKQLFTFYFLLFTLQKDYDAVFVHMNPIWVVLGGLSWRMMNKKIFLWYTHKSVTWKLKLAEKLANTIFTASSESFRLPSKKIIVTGHGIDTELFKPMIITDTEPRITTDKISGNQALNPRESVIKILSIGRIAEVKNYETLVRAAKILKDKDIGFSITMIGEPALKKDFVYEQKLKSLIDELGLRADFNFLGKINHRDLPLYYQSHNLFIHLSKTGSLDKAILEAMACGMNVLSSSDSARSFLPAELIFDENNVQELADKIKKTDEKEFSGQLRQYVVENHNLNKLIDKIAGLIIKK
ncbi:MAG: glycosyltransferase family 4 protein [Patescibacteria group bacterium]